MNMGFSRRAVFALRAAIIVLATAWLGAWMLVVWKVAG